MKAASPVPIDDELAAKLGLESLDVLKERVRDQLKSAELADHHFRNYLRLDPRGQHAEEATGSLLTRVP